MPAIRDLDERPSAEVRARGRHAMLAAGLIRGPRDQEVRDLLLSAASRRGLAARDLSDLPYLLGRSPGARELLLGGLREELAARGYGGVSAEAVLARGLRLGRLLPRADAALRVLSLGPEGLQGMASLLDRVAAEVGAGRPLMLVVLYGASPELRAAADAALSRALQELGPAGLAGALEGYRAAGGSPIDLLAYAKVANMSRREALLSRLGNLWRQAGRTAPYVAHHALRLAAAPLLDALGMIPGFRSVAAYLPNVGVSQAFVSGVSDNLRRYGPRTFGGLGAAS